MQLDANSLSRRVSGSTMQLRCVAQTFSYTNVCTIHAHGLHTVPNSCVCHTAPTHLLLQNMPCRFLTGSIEEFSVHTGLSEAFVGMIILPIAGNACEHITAIVVAMKNKMDLSLGVSACACCRELLDGNMPLCIEGYFTLCGANSGEQNVWKQSRGHHNACSVRLLFACGWLIYRLLA